MLLRAQTTLDKSSTDVTVPNLIGVLAGDFAKMMDLARDAQKALPSVVTNARATSLVESLAAWATSLMATGKARLPARMAHNIGIAGPTAKKLAELINQTADGIGHTSTSYSLAQREAFYDMAFTHELSTTLKSQWSTTRAWHFKANISVDIKNID